MHQELINQIPGYPKYKRGLAKIDLSGSDYSDKSLEDRTIPVKDLPTSEPNVILSRGAFNQDIHFPALDMDVPCELIPSSTEGHSHLYINKSMPWADYALLMMVMGKVGLLEPGYVNASLARKTSVLRLPWVKKGEEPAPKPPTEADLAIYFD